MSYDLFAQAFAHGYGVQDRRIADVVLDALRPFLVAAPDEKGFCHARVSDGGEADFYVGSDGHGFMVKPLLAWRDDEAHRASGASSAARCSRTWTAARPD